MNLVSSKLRTSVEQSSQIETKGEEIFARPKTDRKLISKILADLLQINRKKISKPNRKMYTEYEQTTDVREHLKASNYLNKCLNLLVIREIEN